MQDRTDSLEAKAFLTYNEQLAKDNKENSVLVRIWKSEAKQNSISRVIIEGYNPFEENTFVLIIEPPQTQSTYDRLSIKLYSHPHGEKQEFKPPADYARRLYNMDKTHYFDLACQYGTCKYGAGKIDADKPFGIQIQRGDKCMPFAWLILCIMGVTGSIDSEDGTAILLHADSYNPKLYESGQAIIDSLVHNPCEIMPLLDKVRRLQHQRHPDKGPNNAGADETPLAISGQREAKHSTFFKPEARPSLSTSQIFMVIVGVLLGILPGILLYCHFNQVNAEQARTPLLGR